MKNKGNTTIIFLILAVFIALFLGIFLFWRQTPEKTPQNSRVKNTNEKSPTNSSFLNREHGYSLIVPSGAFLDAKNKSEVIISNVSNPTLPYPKDGEIVVTIWADEKKSTENFGWGKFDMVQKLFTNLQKSGQGDLVANKGSKYVKEKMAKISGVEVIFFNTIPNPETATEFIKETGIVAIWENKSYYLSVVSGKITDEQTRFTTDDFLTKVLESFKFLNGRQNNWTQYPDLKRGFELSLPIDVMVSFDQENNPNFVSLEQFDLDPRNIKPISRIFFEIYQNPTNLSLKDFVLKNKLNDYTGFAANPEAITTVTPTNLFKNAEAVSWSCENYCNIGRNFLVKQSQAKFVFIHTDIDPFDDNLKSDQKETIKKILESATFFVVPSPKTFPGWKTFSNEKFSFQYPSDWVSTKPKNQQNPMDAHVGDPNTKHGFNVLYNLKGIGLECHKNAEEFSFVLSGKTFKTNVMRGFKDSMCDSEKDVGIMHFLKNGDDSFFLTYGPSDEDQKNGFQIFHKIASSFVFK